MPKEKSSMETGSLPPPSPMYTSNFRSSSDQELAWNHKVELIRLVGVVLLFDIQSHYEYL